MIIAIIILLFASIFFSISETDLSAVNRMKLQSKAEQGENKANKIYQLLNKPSVYLTAIVIGKNVANIILISLVTLWSENREFNMILTILLAIIGVIIICEVVPRAFAEAYPEKTTRWIYPILVGYIFVIKPLIIILNQLTKIIKNMVPNHSQEEQRFSKEEIRQIVTIAESQGAFNEVEKNRIQGVMNFEKLKITDIDTTPRINVTAFPSDISYEEAYETVVSNPYTRYPVYDEDIDHIIGVFHSKYLLAWSRKTTDDISNYISEPLFVNEHNRAEWVLRKMTVSRKHLAIVLDEYGGTDAIVSHEDLIEEMLGMEIEDEMDEEEREKLKQQLTAYYKK
ncbi:hemolysin family protein [Staphylococcus gallinarum]|uniref:hemolysin family protein n=1 Tax=Staphylococcus gallinarum TaxID=1293 RepID=UPI001E49483C|nr:CNNM domain-containing protein [Staphylococcus gallinarum]MCD8828700.1 CNNM domain-containing protein [Staphylococcus gallinarum]MEB6054518.1 CNNM domain-containing protein [Staphylococcus gallinarum]